MTFWQDLDRHGAAIAFVDAEGATISYAALAAAADALDMPAGALVLLELDHSIAAMAAYLAALRRNAPAIILNAGDGIAADRMIAAFGPAARWRPEHGVEPLADTSPAVHPDLAILLSTSGTTGATKLVRLSAGAVDANARSIADYLGIDGAERAITTLPLGYSYGLSVINSHLAAGACVILNSLSVIEPGFRALVEAERATSLAGVPYTYELLERAGLLDALPKTIRTMTQAGGRLAPERVRAIAERAAAQGQLFFVMYGQTEATARMAYLPPDRAAAHPDCIGCAIPGGSFALVDPETGAPAEQRGELVYTGPNVMMGYAEQATDLARGAERDRLATGDLAEWATPDLLRIVGRKSRFLKLFGLRLSLEEVEAEARRQGWALVATGTDERLVLACEGRAAGGADVYFAQRYGLPPSRVALVAFDTLPRLPSGKIDYQAILAAVPAAAIEAPAADRLEALRRLLARTFPHRAIEDGHSFLALEGDSLSYIAVSLGIEQITGSLPPQWESLPIATLAESGDAATRRSLARVEVSVLARAIAPVMIVANHAGDSAVRGGAALLMVVAGQNFARFSRADLIAGRWGRILSALTINVLLPYWLILGGFELVKRAPSWPELLLVNNWLGRPSITGFETWFVQVLAQSILLCILIALPPPMRRLWRARPFAVGYGLLLAGALFAICHYLWWTNVLHHGGRELSWQLWLFAAGLATWDATTQVRRTGIVLVVALVASLLYGADAPRLIASVGGVALLLWARKLPVPLLLLPLLTVIGSASLFIYMIHGHAPMHSATDKMPVDLIRISSGILMGVAGWYLYERARTLIGRVWRRN